MISKLYERCQKLVSGEDFHANSVFLIDDVKSTIELGKMRDPEKVVVRIRPVNTAKYNLRVFYLRIDHEIEQNLLKEVQELSFCQERGRLVNKAEAAEIVTDDTEARKAIRKTLKDFLVDPVEKCYCCLEETNNSLPCHQKHALCFRCIFKILALDDTDGCAKIKCGICGKKSKFCEQCDAMMLSGNVCQRCGADDDDDEEEEDI